MGILDKKSSYRSFSIDIDAIQAANEAVIRGDKDAETFFVDALIALTFTDFPELAALANYLAGADQSNIPRGTFDSTVRKQELTANLLRAFGDRFGKAFSSGTSRVELEYEAELQEMPNAPNLTVVDTWENTNKKTNNILVYRYNNKWFISGKDDREQFVRYEVDSESELGKALAADKTGLQLLPLAKSFLVKKGHKQYGKVNTQKFFHNLANFVEQGFATAAYNDLLKIKHKGTDTALEFKDFLAKHTLEAIEVLLDPSISSEAQRVVTLKAVLDKLDQGVNHQVGRDLVDNGILIVDKKHPKGFAIDFDNRDNYQAYLQNFWFYLKNHYQLNDGQIASIAHLANQAALAGMYNANIQKQIEANLGSEVSLEVKKSLWLKFDENNQLKEVIANQVFSVMNIETGIATPIAESTCIFRPEEKISQVAPVKMLPGNQGTPNLTFHYRAYNKNGTITLSSKTPLLAFSYASRFRRFRAYLGNNWKKLLFGGLFLATAAVAAPFLWPAYATFVAGYIAFNVAAIVVEATTGVILGSALVAAGERVIAGVKRLFGPKKPKLFIKENLNIAVQAIVSELGESIDITAENTATLTEILLRKLLELHRKIHPRRGTQDTVSKLHELYFKIFNEHGKEQADNFRGLIIQLAEKAKKSKLQAIVASAMEGHPDLDFKLDSLVKKFDRIVETYPLPKEMAETIQEILPSSTGRIFGSLQRTELIESIKLVFLYVMPNHTWQDWKKLEAQLQEKDLTGLKATLRTDLSQLQDSKALLNLYKGLKTMDRYHPGEATEIIAEKETKDHRKLSEEEVNKIKQAKFSPKEIDAVTKQIIGALSTKTTSSAAVTGLDDLAKQVTDIVSQELVGVITAIASKFTNVSEMNALLQPDVLKNKKISGLQNVLKGQLLKIAGVTGAVTKLKQAYMQFTKFSTSGNSSVVPFDFIRHLQFVSSRDTQIKNLVDAFVKDIPNTGGLVTSSESEKSTIGSSTEESYKKDADADISKETAAAQVVEDETKKTTTAVTVKK